MIEQYNFQQFPKSWRWQTEVSEFSRLIVPCCWTGYSDVPVSVACASPWHEEWIRRRRAQPWTTGLRRCRHMKLRQVWWGHAAEALVSQKPCLLWRPSPVKNGIFSLSNMQ